MFKEFAPDHSLLGWSLDVNQSSLIRIRALSLHKARSTKIVLGDQLVGS